ncbi:MAG TPA: PspA/IM30 family protein [Bacteroidota bacterium]|jgi:phage shock protein A|nr:PspA/IM30 family protein [Bacteroidota bacterium]
MGIFARMSDIFKANINDLLDKAEDPEKMIKQMVIEMEEAVSKAATAVGQAIANEKMLQKQVDDKKKAAEDWQKKAIQAVNAGRDDLAKQALEKKNSFSKAANDLEPLLIEARNTSANLRAQLDKLRAKLEEARLRQNTLIARSQAAKAKKQIAASVSGIGDDAFANFDKYEQKIIKQESEADALSELAGQDTRLEDEFAKLDSGTAVDDELAQLKASLNK